MLRISPTPTSATQKSMNFVDEFGKGDCAKNKVRRASASTKKPIKIDYPSSNHVSHSVSNFVSNSAKNVSDYLTSDIKKTFNQLCQAFIKAPILQHFDLEQYIQVETYASEHTISRMLSQLTNDLGQWHPVTYFLHKMISTKTWYKTHNSKLLAIVKAFKTWRHYLEICKHEVFVFTNYNNLCRFMDTKSLSSCQVW